MTINYTILPFMTYFYKNFSDFFIGTQTSNKANKATSYEVALSFILETYILETIISICPTISNLPKPDGNIK